MQRTGRDSGGMHTWSITGASSRTPQDAVRARTSSVLVGKNDRQWKPEAAPDAIAGLSRGENLSKRLIRIAPEDEALVE